MAAVGGGGLAVIGPGVPRLTADPACARGAARARMGAMERIAGWVPFLIFLVLAAAGSAAGIAEFAANH